MKCRRCGVDIAEDSRNCPLCGIAQNTYITPRNYSGLTVKKKRRANTLVSIITMAISIVGIFLMIFFSNKATDEKDFQKVLEAFEKGDDQLLMMTVAQYRKNHPRSTDRIAEAENYLLVLRGYGPEVPEDETPVDINMTLAGERIGFESVVLSEPNFEKARSLTIYWRNITKKTITHIYFRVNAYDSSGNPVDCTVRERSDALLEQKNLFSPNLTGDIYRSNWLNVWYGESIEYVKIERVIIYYDDETSESLPVEVNK